MRPKKNGAIKLKGMHLNQDFNHSATMLDRTKPPKKYIQMLDSLAKVK